MTQVPAGLQAQVSIGHGVEFETGRVGLTMSVRVLVEVPSGGDYYSEPEQRLLLLIGESPLPRRRWEVRTLECVVFPTRRSKAGEKYLEAVRECCAVLNEVELYDDPDWKGAYALFRSVFKNCVEETAKNRLARLKVRA